jgi:hypothetical protein
MKKLINRVIWSKEFDISMVIMGIVNITLGILSFRTDKRFKDNK